MSENESSGLPPRIYVPIVALIARNLSLHHGVSRRDWIRRHRLGLRQGGESRSRRIARTTRFAERVEGGPPAPVVAQLQTLRARIAAHPNDDVALTQLADMYLAANHFQEAIPLYRRALRANPHNVAAQTGLAQARQAMSRE